MHSASSFRSVLRCDKHDQLKWVPSLEWIVYTCDIQNIVIKPKIGVDCYWMSLLFLSAFKQFSYTSEPHFYFCLNIF